MIPYLFVFCVSIFFTYLADRYYNNKFVFCLFSIFALTPTILLAGFRDNTIGTDIQTYVLSTFYMAGQYSDWGDFFSESNIDLFFATLIYISNKFFNDINGALIVISAFTIICIYVAIVKMRQYLSMSFSMFVYLFSFYNLSLNLMRQSMAVSICLFLFVMIFHKEYIKAIIASVLAFYCHSSSVFFILPVIIYMFLHYKLIHGKPVWKWLIIYFFSLPLLFVLFDYVLTFFVDIGLFSEKYLMYSTSNQHGGTSENTIFILIYITFTVIIYNMIKSYGKNLNYTYSLLIVYSTLIIGLLSTISIWAGRLSLYFQIITVIMFPILISNLPSKKKVAYKSVFAVLITFYWWYTYIINNVSETYPYSSKILGI